MNRYILFILVILASINYNHKFFNNLSSGIINKLCLIAITIIISLENPTYGIICLIILFNLLSLDTYHNEKFKCKFNDDREP